MVERAYTAECSVAAMVISPFILRRVGLRRFCNAFFSLNSGQRAEEIIVPPLSIMFDTSRHRISFINFSAYKAS